MYLKTVSTFSESAASEALVVPYSIKNSKPLYVGFDRFSLLSQLSTPIKMGDFTAKRGEVFILYPDGLKEKRCFMLGLGENELVSTESLRKAFAGLVKKCHQLHLTKISILAPSVKHLSIEAVCQGIAEGLLLTNYVFEKLKNTTKSNGKLLEQAQLIGFSKKEQKLFNKYTHVCTGVNLARDLVNENADTVNAKKLVEIAKGFAKEFPKIKTEIFDRKKLEKEKLKLLLAVNQGAAIDPALIMVKYQGQPKEKTSTVILGKGVTYDSGGLQLKPRAGNIIHMKCDMGGAAAVLGTLYAVAKLDLKINLVGVIPACENAIGNKAYKPGDVYESYFGKTVEIISTDAEGRLILADALAYAEKKLKPNCLIDLATLTGGVVAALGDEISGVMGNHSALTQKLIFSGEKSGEKLWELPLYENYKAGLKSKIADLKNSTGQAAGYPSAVIAGLFLQEFIKSTPWAHLDIAGTAYLKEPKDYQPTKATGVGVRLILAFLEELIDSQEDL